MNDNSEIAGLPPHGWLVVACKGGWEMIAARELTKQGFRVWCPREVKQRMNRGTKVLRREPFIPGYILVALTPGRRLAEMCHPINNTRGVVAIIMGAKGKGGRTIVIEPGKNVLPALVGHPKVLELRRDLWTAWHDLRRSIEAARRPRRFEAGTELEVLTGPYKGKRGKVSRLFLVSPQQRVTLLLDGCRTPVPLSLPAAHVAETATIMGGGSVSKRR